MSETSNTVGTHVTPAPDIVITKFSILAYCLHLAISMTLFVGFWSAALTPSGFTSRAIFENKVWWLIALLFTPITLWAEAVVMQQMIFHDRRAVWIEDGRLNIIDFRSVRARSVAIASIGKLWLDSLVLSDLVPGPGFPCVSLRTKDGLRGDSILTLFLADSAPVVRARLAEALSLRRISETTGLISSIR